MWQARSPSDVDPMQNLCQVSDSGNAWPIPLPAVMNPADPCSVHQWHCQAQVHGLSKLSPVLALRIHRFDDRGDRLQFFILDSWNIPIPLFTDQTLATHTVPHEVSAIILHSRATVFQGHCSAVLLEDGSPKFLTADGKRATRVKAKDIPQICQNAYIVILKQKTVTL